jgi:hypothetical protein
MLCGVRKARWPALFKVQGEEVSMSAPLLPVGSPARVRIRRVVRIQYRLEWEYDGLGEYLTFNDAGDELECESFDYIERRCRVRYLQSAPVAYRMAALRLIMARRDRYATGITENEHPRKLTGCTKCDEAPGVRYLGHGEYTDDSRCRYHGGDGFDVLVKRLARWLRWRDERSFLARSRAWFSRLREQGKAA